MWTPEQPIQELSARIRPIFLQEFKRMHVELELNPLHSTVVGIGEPYWVDRRRVLHSKPPEWYSVLWHEYAYAPTGRYQRSRHSRLRRDYSLASLERLSQETDLSYPGIYRHYALQAWHDEIYRTYVFERLTEGKQEEQFIPPSKEVLDFFNLTHDLAVLYGLPELDLPDRSLNDCPF